MKNCKDDKLKAIGIVALLIIVNWLLIYFANGISSIAPYLFFIPITYASWKLDPKGGLIVGFISGVILSPFMSIGISEQLGQPIYNWWILRLIFLSVYGYGMGNFILQLKRQIGNDELMGIPSRKNFYDYLTNELSSIKKPFYVVLINIDDFKKINDSIGHIAADLLLVDIKSRVMKCINKNDIIARWSGDEFSIILFREQEIELGDACDHMIKSLQGPYEVNGNEFFINASVGISSISTKHQSKGILVKQAETAMRYVKERGKKGYKFYTEELERNSLQEKLLESKLHKAIKDDQFELYYQPKLYCKHRNIYGVEALLRWNHPEEGMISPSVFIPLAEKTGLIIPIGNWVLETACKQIKKWQTLHYKDICISVNVSAIQIQAENFVETVANVIEKTGIKPEMLEIEITESSIMEDTIENIMKLNELKDIGVGISLDDFGKGYSSLNYLKILPIDTLKVDKSFIQNIEYDPKEKVITESIIRMSKALGLTVLAEGIENETQNVLLCELDCDAMQGFYFSRPLPIEELEKLLEKDVIASLQSN